MNVIEIMKKFNTDKKCIEYLETQRWGEVPVCVYCNSIQTTPMPKQLRHHCNSCNKSFSVTVGTILHNTKMPLQKWFLAISLVLNARKGISARQLSRDIEVNKDTAWSMLMRIREAMDDDFGLLNGFVEMDETYIGGEKRQKTKKGMKVKSNTGRGGKGKAIVAGMVERGGKVHARCIERANFDTLSSMIKSKVNISNATLVTDEHTAYRKVSTFIKHQFINHSLYFSRNGVHTNTIEGFWSLLKRGIIGQYHSVSVKHLNQYVIEFCYRYNTRKDDRNTVFQVT